MSERKLRTRIINNPDCPHKTAIRSGGGSPVPAGVANRGEGSVIVSAVCFSRIAVNENGHAAGFSTLRVAPFRLNLTRKQTN
jgi:hypothetical protein